MTNAFNRRKFLITSAAGASLAAFGTQAGVLAAQDGDKPTVRIGSKNFTGSALINEIAAQVLEDGGYPVDRQLNLGGSLVVHEAVVNDELDMYIEYTGTGLLAILGMELPEIAAASPEAGATPALEGRDPVYDIVAEEYPKQFGLEWLEPWGFNDTYALAMRGDHAEELGVEKISDLEGLAGDFTFGASQEFLVRDDGLPAIEEEYGIEFGDSVGLDPGLMYGALDEGDVDVISAFATDGRIPALGLKVLEDDRGFFPPYYAAPVVRQDLLEESPEVADVLNKMAGEITEEQMQEISFRVDDGNEEISDVARDFLTAEGYIDGE